MRSSAPPDAVAATAIGRRIGLPRRIVTILEGESLLNDATALVSLRTAIAAIGASVSYARVGLDFVVAAGGGLLVGLAVYFVIARVRRVVTDAVLDSGISFVAPFAAYVLAEEIKASGVLAVVVAGLLLGHRAPVIQTAQSRIQERMNWSSIAFLLESAVFLLIGLQAYRIIRGAADGELGLGRVVAVCVAVLGAVIVLRLGWVFLTRYLLVRPGPDPESGRPPSWRASLLLGWAGMRGVVTLAAAFVIPKDTPHRETLLLVAFTVTAGTLFLQGLSLPWLARRLDVPAPDRAADALARANLLQQASQAGIGALAGLKESDPHGVKAQIKDRLERRNFAAWEAVGAKDEETPTETYSRVRREMIDHEREHVLTVRSSGTVPHEVVSEVLGMLDVEESMLDYSQRERIRQHDARTHDMAGACDHLRDEAEEAEPNTPGECSDCVREGLAWVHLRMCTSCGNIGCCDSSVGRHATAHFRAEQHPVMRSAEPGDDWRYCFVDQLTG